LGVGIANRHNLEHLRGKCQVPSSKVAFGLEKVVMARAHG
jgi:hypothetical protein